MAKLSQPDRDHPDGVIDDQVLEVVDLVVEAVDEIEVALRDRVDEVVDEHPDVLVRPTGFLRRLRVERLLAGRRLRDRDEPLGRRDHVDLLVVDAVFSRDDDREQEDAEDVVAVRLDPRARFVVVDVRGEQRGARRGVDVLRQLCLQFLFGRIDEVDPPRVDVSHAASFRPRRLPPGPGRVPRPRGSALRPARPYSPNRRPSRPAGRCGPGRRRQRRHQAHSSRSSRAG